MIRRSLAPFAALSAAALLLAGTPAQAAAVDLHTALQLEAYDYATHTLRAEQAQRDGNAAAVGAFTAAATEDRDVHLAALAELYGLVGTDAQNLQAGIDGETYEATVMYPEFSATATAEGCDAAASLFNSIAAEEWMHARKYSAALSAVTTGSGSIPRPSSLQWITVTPSTPLCGADSQTTKNLATAMHGEALAKQKYRLFAAKAAEGGNQRLAALFEGTGEVEFREHFSDEALMVGLLADTDTNLVRAAANETWEATDVYATDFTWIAADEAAQAAAFLAAR